LKTFFEGGMRKIMRRITAAMHLRPPEADNEESRIGRKFFLTSGAGHVPSPKDEGTSSVSSKKGDTKEGSPFDTRLVRDLDFCGRRRYLEEPCRTTTQKLFG
jgi:hypothetical protein